MTCQPGYIGNRFWGTNNHSFCWEERHVRIVHALMDACVMSLSVKRRTTSWGKCNLRSGLGKRSSFEELSSVWQGTLLLKVPQNRNLDPFEKELPHLYLRFTTICILINPYPQRYNVHDDSWTELNATLPTSINLHSTMFLEDPYC